MDKIIIEALTIRCIIGDYEWERKRAQKIILNIEMEADLKKACKKDLLDASMLDYNKLTKEILKFVEKSSFHLIEALAEAVTKICLKQPAVKNCKVRLSKPAAMRAAKAAVVEIYRKR